MSGHDRPGGAGFPRGPVGILGCGLIGASLAAALSQLEMEVWGADRRDLAPLVERGWIARQVEADELLDAELVVLALPPAGIRGALARLPFRSGQLVTDTGSVKVAVEEAARRLPRGVRFVGGHPMAGGTGSGFEVARPDLFRGSVWVLSSTAAWEDRQQLAGLVRRLGADPLVCAPERHDRLVALTSHLPQLFSTALAAELESVDDPLVQRLLGPGGRDFLRLARSSYDLWREILTANRDEVFRAFQAVAARAGQPPEVLEGEFEAARKLMGEVEGTREREAPAPLPERPAEGAGGMDATDGTGGGDGDEG